MNAIGEYWEIALSFWLFVEKGIARRECGIVFSHLISVNNTITAQFDAMHHYQYVRQINTGEHQKTFDFIVVACPTRIIDFWLMVFKLLLNRPKASEPRYMR